MAGIAMKIMGILNVTPDSFSDGGKFSDFQSAITQADELIAAGADILDVGGESTRPFADPVTAQEELRRVIPIIEAIRQKHSITISIDTTKAVVAREALQAGADIINDISALGKDPEMVEVVRQSSVPVIIMHMQGTPSDMQIDPVYSDVVAEIIDFFKKRIAWITAKGIDRNRLIIDPGIGFGKTLHHNLSIIKHLDTFSSLNLPLLLGHSRKRFLGTIIGTPAAKERDLATAVIAALSAAQNIAMVRVHNVAATRQALLLAEAVRTAA